MTSRAPNSQTQESAAHQIDLKIGDVKSQLIAIVGKPSPGPKYQKSRRRMVLGIRRLVFRGLAPLSFRTGNLFPHKLVVRLVIVERANDVIPIAPRLFQRNTTA